MKCPLCKGEKEICGIFPVYAEDVPTEDRKMTVTIPCYRCNATGKVSIKMLKWIRDGKKLKEKRRALKLTVRMAYKQIEGDFEECCIAPSTLMDMELGVIKPDMKVYDGLVPSDLQGSG